jgi:hypothetical protein
MAIFPHEVIGGGSELDTRVIGYKFGCKCLVGFGELVLGEG